MPVNHLRRVCSTIGTSQPHHICIIKLPPTAHANTSNGLISLKSARWVSRQAHGPKWTKFIDVVMAREDFSKTKILQADHFFGKIYSSGSTLNSSIRSGKTKQFRNSIPNAESFQRRNDLQHYDPGRPLNVSFGQFDRESRLIRSQEGPFPHEQPLTSDR